MGWDGMHEDFGRRLTGVESNMSPSNICSPICRSEGHFERRKTEFAGCGESGGGIRFLDAKGKKKKNLRKKQER